MKMGKERESSVGQNRGDDSVVLQLSESYSFPADTITFIRFHCTTKHRDLTSRKNVFGEDVSCLSWICDSFDWFYNTWCQAGPLLDQEMCKKIEVAARSGDLLLLDLKERSHKRYFFSINFPVFQMEKVPLDLLNTKISAVTGDLFCVSLILKTDKCCFLETGSFWSQVDASPFLVLWNNSVL